VAGLTINITRVDTAPGKAMGQQGENGSVGGNRSWADQSVGAEHGSDGQREDLGVTLVTTDQKQPVPP
jgi:hypothetical protein